MNTSTDWDKCVICQLNTKESLQCPVNNRNLDAECGYKCFADILRCFNETSKLPIAININRLDDGTGLSSTLEKNLAKWHKSCRMKFNKKTLKRCQDLSIQQQAQQQNHADDTSEIGPTSSKRTFTRSEVKSCASKGKSECFLCGSTDTSEVLHLATTLEIDKKVRSCAHDLNDQRVLAALSAGDMVALDLKYHLNCLNKFYNRRRAVQNDLNDNERLIKVHESYAFAELLTYIEDVSLNTNAAPVFKLSDIGKIYKDILHEYGIESTLRNTDLKNKILSNFPSMEAFKSGRDVLLAFKDDVGSVLSKAYGINYDEEAIHFTKTASIIRRDILGKKVEFTGEFLNDAQKSSVPESLAFLLSLIHKGPTCNSKGETCTNEPVKQSVSSIGQLIVFNCNIDKRYQKSREPPLPVYLGLSIHTLTRKKSVIDELYHLGLSISYDRVLDISTRLGISICNMYEFENAVAPPNLLKGVFVTGSADNIDHNPSSTTSTESFHGTVLQMNSHPTASNSGTKRPRIKLFEGKLDSKSVPVLPDFYTEIMPTIKLKDSCTALDINFIVPALSNKTITERENPWLDYVKDVVESGEPLCHHNYTVSWAAFHAKKVPVTIEPTSISGMLPLFEDQAHSPAMIRHAMNIVRNTTQNLNPGQTPVITLDQPLFALAKKIQWNYPATFSERSFVVLFGGLHIEMGIMKMLGSWMQGSGWVELLSKASVAHEGTADSFIRVSHVTKTRRAHQVTAAALHILRHRAFMEGDAIEDDINFETWCQRKEDNVPQYQYWSIVLRLETLLLGFIRSIREGNFECYKETLAAIIPWCFALNRTNYSRWLSVHLRDMLCLEETCPDVYREFVKGNFVVRKTHNPFSAIAIDQALEQTNAVIKGDGGAVGILQKPEAIRRWMIVGPEIARIVAQFGDNSHSERRHHEQINSFQQRFLTDVDQMVKSFEDQGNPFTETSGDLLRLHNKEIMPEEAVKTLKNIEKIGREQMSDFFKERLHSQAKLVCDVIKKNKLYLFGTAPVKNKTKQQLQVRSLRNDCTLFSRCYIGCQTRNGDLDKFFQFENNPCPPSISHDGQLRMGKKADLLACLEDTNAECGTVQHVDAILLDGAAIVNMLIPPKQLATFGEYATQVFVPFILSQLRKSERVDIVWDVYREDSLKSQTRQKRGQGTRRRVEPANFLPKNWQEFLRTNENKTELFAMLGEFSLKIESSRGTIVVTRGEAVLCNNDTTSLDDISPCNHEEADTRLIVHLYHVFKQKDEVIVRTVDSDVVVLCIVTASQFISKKIWLEFGVGKNFRIIPAHEISNTLGPDKSAALPFFHAFTGCDTCSSFAGRGKKSAWKIWKLLPEMTSTFMRLSQPIVEQLDEITFRALEKFVVLLYDRTSTHTRVNECRKELFVHKGKPMESLPPTEDALRLHTLRVVHQAGFVWGMASNSTPVIPSPSNWGWIKGSSGLWEPKWTTLADAINSCDEVVVCKCKNDCYSDQCTCLVSGQPCCESCKCRGACND